MCNVSKGRVTLWLTEGKIDGAAIIGEGRSAKIDADLARAQLRERLSTNEHCGLNGLNTKLDDAPVRDVVETPPEELKAPIPASRKWKS
jgi:hypothetical protein